MLLKYNPDIHCPKCDHIDIGVYYCEGYVLPRSTKQCNFLPPITHEHLHRTCQRCGYTWLERCSFSEGKK